MINDAFANPVWGPGHFVESNSDCISFDYSAPTASRPAGLDAQQALERATDFAGRKQWDKALAVLSKLPQNGIVRRLRLDALAGLGDPQRTIAALSDPLLPEEIVLLGASLIDNGTAAQLESYTSLEVVRNSDDASVKEVVRRVLRRAAQ
jgi:hypothetical protein